MLAIDTDTDVLAVCHIFRGDSRHRTARAFLSASATVERGVPIFALLELCGLAATAGKPDDAQEVFDCYVSADDIVVLYLPIPLASPQVFWEEQNAQLLARIKRSMRLGDAAILWTVETTGCEALVTWNTRHYAGKTSLRVLTPDEWLQAQ